MSGPARTVPPDRAAVAVRVLGVTALAGVVATVWLGLFVTPPDEFMGNLVRLLYVHPPMAWVAFLAYGVASLASLLYLWPRTCAEHFDRLAGASAEVGVVFTGLTLVSGSIWGRPPGALGGSGTLSSRPRRCCSSSISAISPCGVCRARSTSAPGARRSGP